MDGIATHIDSWCSTAKRGWTLRALHRAALPTEVATEDLVDVIAGADGDDQDKQPVVVDLVADAVVADPDTPDICVPLQRAAANRPGCVAQGFDHVFDRFGVGGLLAAERVEELLRAAQDVNRVRHSGVSAEKSDG